MRIAALSTIVALAALVGLGACSSTHSSNSVAPPVNPDTDERNALAGPKVATSSTEPRVKVVNAVCPIASSNAVGQGNTTVASLTREFRGKKVGFCCEHCPPVWDDLTNDEQQAALDAAIAGEKKDPKKS